MSATLAATLSAAITAAATLVTLDAVGDLSEEPGLVPVFGVLVGGFAFTALCFHIFRVRAAWKLGGAGIPNQQIESHVAMTEFIVNDAAHSPQSPDEGWVEKPNES